MDSRTDALGPLREVLRRPDRRTWRRFLPPARGAHRPSTPPTPAPPDRWPSEPPEDPPVDHRPRAWQVVAGVLMLAAGVVLGTGLLPATPVDRPPDLALLPPAPSGADDPMPSPSTTESASARVWPVERVEVVGRTVRTDAGRWEVGAEGDVVTVGDWNCDRSRTPALLRPTDGRIAVFDRWASAGDVEPARPVATVGGASTLEPGRTCGELVVRTGAGTEQIFDTRIAAGEVAP